MQGHNRPANAFQPQGYSVTTKGGTMLGHNLCSGLCGVITHIVNKSSLAEVRRN